MRQAVLVVAASMAVAGCTSGPDYSPPAGPASKAVQSGAFLRGGDAGEAGPAARWWSGFNDPVLAGLIDESLAGAFDIKAAQARVIQARASQRGRQAARLPSVNTSATSIHANLADQAFGTEQSGTSLYNLGFDANWEIDLWGGGRRSVEKSRAEAEAAEAKLADAKVSLSAELAKTYIALRVLEAALPLLDARRDLEITIARSAQQRFAAGTASRVPADTALIQIERTASERASLSAEAAVMRDLLAVLSGKAPGSLDDLPPAPVPLPPSRVVVGDPAAMLARRPDIRVAERQLAAATAQIGIERSRQLPSLSFIGLIGIGGSDPGDIFDASQMSSIAIPRLSWKPFDFGRANAARKASEAGRDAAEADYQQAVLRALQDAEASLARFGAARIDFGGSVSVSRHAAGIAMLQGQRARAGTIGRTDALEAECRAIDARLGELRRRGDVSAAYVAVVKSLGLGWADGPEMVGKRTP